MKFTEKLKTAVQNSGSTLCVGLDPNPAFFPESINQSHASLEAQTLSFCKSVIKSTQEFCAAFKPNLGFFEALGKDGFSVLAEVLEYIPKDKIVVADAKRGDINTTAEMYKTSFFDQLNVDSITLNPLMGYETLNAFLKDESKAVYVLSLTSNPGASDFFMKPFDGFDMMAESIASNLNSISKQSETHIGMVVGATQTEFATRVLSHYSSASLLIPGFGAQGGSVSDLEKMLENHQGIPLINSSRGIIYAGKNESNWTNLVSKAASSSRDNLHKITQKYV